MKKNKLKELKTVLLALSLALSTTSCNSKKEEVGFKIENSNLPGHFHNDGLYTYLLDKNELNMENTRPGKYASDVTFLREEDSYKIHNNFQGKVEAKFIKNNMFVFNQDEYAYLDSYFNNKYFIFQYDSKILKEFDGGLYTLTECTVTSKKNITLQNGLTINKGDYLESSMIYYDNSQIAFYQNATGSLNKLLRDYQRGNINKGLIEVEGNILDEVQYVGTREMREMLNYLNEDNHNAKTLKKELYDVLMK